MLALANFSPPDPIPLPAPVWIFKVLHCTVLSLHFVTVQWMLGWLLIGLVWNFFGRARQNAPMIAGSGRIVGTLPILMTYLINFGIPPLLFAQVLYGNFLYTSSVLIGAWWMSVIALVILTYSALYAGSLRAEKTRGWWGFGLVALLLAVSIAKIYSTNMTLMLRPEAWVEMFRANAHGTGLPPADPTTTPRWLFMLAGGLTVGGLALITTGARKKASAENGFLVFHGGWIASAGALLQAAVAWRVFHTQPQAIQAKLSASAFYGPLPIVWLALAAVVVVLGLLATVLREKATGWLATGAALLGVLLTATMTIYRDGIRDLTLLANGFDVWDAKVVANWPVVLLFLAIFVAGLLGMGWLIAVVLKSKPQVAESQIQIEEPVQ